MRTAILLSMLLLAGNAAAEVTRIEIVSQKPYAGGRSFGAVGPYVHVVGRYVGELDPWNPSNRGIVDLKLAARNARGKVEYSADFELLRPADPYKGNGTLLYDVNNRGNKRVLHLLNDTPATNALDNPASAGDGFLMREGYTIAWSGWIWGLPANAGLLRLEAPRVAAAPATTNILGLPGSAPPQPLEQPVWDEFLFNDARQREATLTFPAASLDKAKAQLTVRDRNEDTPSTIQAAAWEFVDENAIRLLPRGTPFRPGALYQFAYRTKNPPVAGVGFAAVRDWIAFLRYQQKDAAGTANPLGPDGRHKVTVALAHGTSQSGRFLRDLLYQGFNETEDLRPVFDGMNPHIASARIFLNFRAAQPNRAYSLGYGFLGYPDAGFPYAYEKTLDPFHRTEDGLLERCRKRGACPKILQTVSSTEYWQGGHSLNTTDPRGDKDLVLPDNVRIVHFAGTEHVITPTMAKGVCFAPANTAVDPRPALRALIVALDRWVKGGNPPPPSVYPRLADGSLVAASAQQWPALPAPFAPPRSPNPMLQFEYGQRYADGILDTAPPAPSHFRYKVFVPQVDADGNEVAGLRMPEQAVPFATTTGWSLRSPEAGGAGELCYLDGLALPFAKTKAEREAAKDPRPSMEERYGSRAAYADKVRAAAKELQAKGYLLPEDVEKIVERASANW
jgi:hypothetical protein